MTTAALVTGAASGIGRATARALAEAGHPTFGLVRSVEQAEALSEEAMITPLLGDVTDDEAVEAAVAAVGEPVGLLVNSAGIVGGGPIEHTPISAYQQVLDVNFLGALRLARAVLPGMRSLGRGTIVNVSSMAATLRISPLGPYVASKVALGAVSEVLAQEVAPAGIRVCVVEPGFVDTPIHDRGMLGYTSHSDQKHLTKRLGLLMRRALDDVSPTTAEDVALAIVGLIGTADPPSRSIVGRDAAILDRLRARHAAHWTDTWASQDDQVWKGAFDEFLAPWD